MENINSIYVYIIGNTNKEKNKIYSYIRNYLMDNNISIQEFDHYSKEKDFIPKQSYVIGFKKSGRLELYVDYERDDDCKIKSFKEFLQWYKYKKGEK